MRSPVRTKKLPGFLRHYFWDTEFAKINPDERRGYIIKRLLEYGNEKAVEWMYQHYKKAEIKNALCDYRGYSGKSANFWAFMLGVKKEDVRCLNRSFRETQKQFWPH